MTKNEEILSKALQALNVMHGDKLLRQQLESKTEIFSPQYTETLETIRKGLKLLDEL